MSRWHLKLMKTAVVAAILLTSCSVGIVKTIEDATPQPSPTIDGEIHSDSGTVVAPVIKLPDNGSHPLADPTAFIQTQEAALDQSHGAGPTLAPGNSPVTPSIGPQTEAATVTLAPESTVNPTTFIQTQEAALDQSHGAGPTLAPGNSPTIMTTLSAPDNNGPQSTQNQSLAATRIILVGGFILLSIFTLILGYRFLKYITESSLKT